VRTDEQSLLQDVLGVLQRAEDPVAVDLELVPVGGDQLRERILVAVPRQGQQLSVHVLTFASPRCCQGPPTKAARGVDDGNARNWAVGERPVRERRPVFTGEDVADGTRPPAHREESPCLLRSS
jgi:hypothetical protein